MISRQISFQRRITIVLVIANLCLLVIYVSAWTKPNPQNNKKTVIRPLTLANEPLEITFELNGRPVNATKAVRAEEGIHTEEFDGDSDWLRNLTLKVRNKSEKVITYIVLDLTFPQTATNEHPRVGLHQVFLGVDPDGKFPRPALRVAPNESLEIPLATRFKDIKTLVEFSRSIENVTEMEVRIHQVLFDNGTLFETGTYYRRNSDPNDPRKWIRIDN
ncbi:MAG: hypothetical protein QOH70_1765 [Blastocatellia bacterium]|jgi:hypothetical protein|nr:hypothetical protein [Blastocatellia bacterium]